MADEPTPKPGTSSGNQLQPKIVHKLAVRTLLAVLALGGLFFGINALREYFRDPGRVGGAETAGSIAALKYHDNGQQAVVILPNGEILESPGFQPGNTERDLAWQPDGTRLYYISDRVDQTFQVYRWRPVPGGESEPRTIGTNGKSNPTFPPDAKVDEGMLLTSRGVVLELNPVDKKTSQVLPPMANEMPTGERSEEDASMTGFNQVYGRLGSSFGKTQYLPGREAVAAILKRDTGDLLIVQDLTLNEGRPKPPTLVTAGDRVEFDVAKDGTIVYSVLNFQWPGQQVPPEFVKNGRVTTPFEHLVGIYKRGEPGVAPIDVSNTDKKAYGQIAISPNGDRLLLVGGEYDGTNFIPKGLVILPVRPGGIQAASPLVQGEVFEPTWDPAGKRIAFARRANGKRAIFTMNDDGTDEKNVTGDKGDFARPIFSPQVPK